MRVALAYAGPQCPRCGTTLAADALRSGEIACAHCGKSFEATAFDLPQRRGPQIADVAIAGPEGSNACANHPRNAAATNCQRCGLFICSLCEMNIGTGSFCPNCFARMRAEGTLPTAVTRYRDYVSMARIAILAGILIWFFAPLFGGLALYYAQKGMKQRREEGRSRAGPIIATVFAVLQILGALSLYAFLVWSFFRVPGGKP
ncbi:MAG TPA: hypothetical protein VNA69_03590 [Thermoanaerobaculia bacterium]|nr:hypothetical protein [Thermoanaerobaculia bacterium]